MGRIAGERKYLTALCADLQRSADLISELDTEGAISRLEPAHFPCVRPHPGLHILCPDSSLK